MNVSDGNNETMFNQEENMTENILEGESEDD